MVCPKNNWMQDVAFLLGNTPVRSAFIAKLLFIEQEFFLEKLLRMMVKFF